MQKNYFSFGHQVSHLEICHLGKFLSMFFQNILAEMHNTAEPINFLNTRHILASRIEEVKKEDR